MLQKLPTRFIFSVPEGGWQRIICVERISPVVKCTTINYCLKKAWNWQYTGRVYPSHARRMDILLGKFLTQGRTPWTKNKHHLWIFQIKNNTEPLWVWFPEWRCKIPFILLELLEETYHAKLSTFLIARIFSSRASLWSVKKIINSSWVVEVDSRSHAENILKMKMFHATKCNAVHAWEI